VRGADHAAVVALVPHQQAVVVEDRGPEGDLRLRVGVEVGQGRGAVLDADLGDRVVGKVRGPQQHAVAVDRVDRGDLGRALLQARVHDVGLAVAADVADRDGRPAVRAELLVDRVVLDAPQLGAGLAVEAEDLAGREVALDAGAPAWC
jgi:hypothetical protein